MNKMEYRDKTEVLGFLAYELLEKKVRAAAKPPRGAAQL